MRKVISAAALAAAVLAVAACGSSSSSTAQSSTPAAGAGAGSSSGNTLLAKSISGTMVLTNSAGLTLYWFSPDTSTTSACTGACLGIWPVVKGPVTAGSGVTGTLGSFTRSDGTVQATWNGHPLYTYTGDTAPGQAGGNGITSFGGTWHEVTLSGGAAPATSPSSAGGYGY